MADNRSNNNEPRTPTHFVFATLEQPNSREREDAKDKWIKLGAGWRNSDGSISCILDCFPLAWNAGYRGRFKLVVQEALERDDRGNTRRDDRRGRR